MKILFVAPRFHTNQYFVTKTLLDKGHQVDFHVVYVGISEDHGLVEPELVKSAWLYEVIAKNLGKQHDYDFKMKYMLPSLWKYYRQFRSSKPDVVIIRNPDHVPSAVALLYAKLLNKKIILYTQGPKHFKPNVKKSFLLDKILRFFRAAWLTAVKGDESSSTTTHPYMYYLPLVVDAEQHLKPNWFEGNSINIMTIGKFQRWKNHLLLLEAVERLRRCFPLKLTIIGECSNEEHRQNFAEVTQFIEKHEMQDYVTLQVNLPFQQVQEEYSKHDLFVLPSTNELVGVSLLEAMGKGLPVVCSDTCGARWYLQEGSNGCVFKSNDLDDLVSKLTLMLSDKERIKAMGVESLKLASSVHSSETYYASLMKLLQERFSLADDKGGLRTNQSEPVSSS